MKLDFLGNNDVELEGACVSHYKYFTIQNIDSPVLVSIYSDCVI